MINLSRNKIYIFLIAIIGLMVAISFILKGNATFFLKYENQESKNQVISYLNQKKISYTDKNNNLYISTGENRSSLLFDLIKKNADKNIEINLLEVDHQKMDTSYFNLYAEQLTDLLYKLNKHLKYKVSSEVTGEEFGVKIFKMNVAVSEVLKRDNIEEISDFVRATVTSVSALDLVVTDDNKRVIYQKQYGLTQNYEIFKKKAQDLISNLLSPIIDSKNSFVLIDTPKNNIINVAVLIKDISGLTTSEKDILSAAISKKLKSQLKIDAQIEIKDISSLSTTEASEDSLSTQDRFLNLLILTTMGILGYLLISLYLRNKRKYLFVKENERQQKIYEEEKNILQDKKSEYCRYIEHQIIYKAEESVKSFDKFVKRSQELVINHHTFSSGEVCAVVIKSLEKEARSILFEGVGSFWVERIITLSSEAKMNEVDLKSEVEVLKFFSQYLENENALMEFTGGENQTDKISKKWNENHYVELIKSAATGKDYKGLLQFLEQENPLFTTLVFVSLNQKLQSEIWKMFSFEQKEKMSLSLIYSDQIHTKSLEQAYECFKEVS